MAFAISFQLTDGATGPLQRMAESVRTPEFRKVVGRAVANRLRKHFSELDSERANTMGGRRTHFYGQARRSVQNPELVGDSGVSVSINHVGIAQRYFGGPIEADPGHALAIPARAEAYGKRPGEFKDLHLVVFGELGKAALVQNTQTALSVGRRRKDGSRTVSRGEEQGGGVFFWLVKRVNQRPDHSVLPTESDLQAAASAAGLEYLRTLAARAQDDRS